MNPTNFMDVAKFLGEVNKAMYGINPYEITAQETAEEMEEDKATDGEHDDESHEDEEGEDHSKCAGCSTCERYDKGAVVVAD